MKVRLEFVLQDAWIGVFWRAGAPAKQYSPRTGEVYFLQRVDVWICLLPCLPIHLSWMRPALPGKE